MLYSIIKMIHIISSTILFGTGVGSAFYLFMINRSKKVEIIYPVLKLVVLADLVFTTPAVFIQPLTGFTLLYISGISPFSGWPLYSLIFFIIAGSTWIFAVSLQLKMRTIAKNAFELKIDLSKRYFVLANYWCCLGVVAFISMMGIFYFMIFKP